MQHDAPEKSGGQKGEIAEIIQADKTAIQTASTDKVNLFKEELNENYFLAKQNMFNDYPIFQF